MAVCIAVVGKDNAPLFTRTIPTQDERKFHYTIHTSLDVVEEKVSSVSKSVTDLRDLYLGLLYPTEDFKVYGFATNTKCKFVVIVESNTSLRENEIRTMFKKLHCAYTDTLCNPFYIPGDDISSKSFVDLVDGMLKKDDKL